MEKQSNKTAALFLGILPFFSGGFYSFLAFPISLFLVVWILRIVKKNGAFRFWLSDALLAITVIVFAYGVSALWAVDKGMSWWGLIKHMPLLLYALAIMQMESEEKKHMLTYVPLSGTIMTVVSFPLQFISVLSERIIPNGRFAGFFEYPNTYALYMLVGVIILLTKDHHKKWDDPMLAVLLFGIFFSGSRTTFLLLLVSVVVICCVRREKKFVCATLAMFGGMILLTLLVQKLETFQAAGRYLSTGTENSTFLCRVLYFKDAIGVIAKNPLGLGYMGYANTQGAFQTGVYHVTYVHNELLQLLLDIGWLPVGLLIVALLKAFFAKKAGYQKRLLLFVILGHCMMDFDLQFLSIWFLLISLLNLHEGKPVRIKSGGKAMLSLSGVVLAAMLWLSAGELCYDLGLVDMCLRITPFHTMALVRQLPEETDIAQLEMKADKILRLDPYVALAYSAKANAAYASGDIAGMMAAKKQAIANNRYSLDEYTDYFDKLYEAMQLYKQQGDQASAEICRQEILNIEGLLVAVEQETDPVAWMLQHKPEPELPQEYINKIRQLST